MFRAAKEQLGSSVIQVTAEKSDFEENNINVIFFYISGCQAIENIKN